MAGAADIRAGRAYVELFLKNSLTKGLAGARKELDSFGKATIGLGMKIAAMGATAALPIAYMTDTFMRFDDAMRLVGAVSQSTDAELKSLTATAKKLGATTSFTAIQVAGLMGELGKAGFSAKEVEKMTKAVLDLARATGTDAVLSSGIMAATLRQFGMGASEATRAADALTVAANASFNSVESLGESLSYAGPVAADFGMSLEDTLAILGALGNVGIQGSNAGTAVRRLLTLGAAEADKLKGIFGVAFQDAAGNARPLVDVLDEVNTATKHLGTAARAAKFNEAFGLLGITGASVIANNAVSIRDLREQLSKAGGVAAETAKKMDGGLGGAFRRMMSAIEAVQLSIGEALAPMLTSLAEKVEKAAGAVIKFVDANQQVISTIALSVGGLILAGGALVTIGLAAKAAAFGLGVMGVAVMPAVIAINLLKAGIAGVKTAAASTLKGVQAMAGGIVVASTKALSALARIGLGGGQIATGIGQIGASVGLQLGRSLVTGLIASGPSIASTLQATLKGVVAGARFHADQLSQAFAPAGKKIAAYFGPPIQRAFDAVYLTVRDMANGYVQLFAPVGAKIAAALGPHLRRAFVESVFAGQAAVEKIKLAWSTVVTYASSGIGRIAAAWRTYAPIIGSNLVKVVGGAFSRIRDIGIGTGRAIAAGTRNIGRGFGNIAGGLGSLAMLFGGAGGGMLGGLAMAAPLLISLVNPVTLIAGGLAAAAYAWANFSSSGKAAMSAISPTIETLKKTLGGVATAIQGGEWSTAFAIGMAGLKVAALDAFAMISQHARPLADTLVGIWDVASTFWGVAIGGISSAWKTFTSFFSDATFGMGGDFGSFAETIVSVFTEAAKAVVDRWEKATKRISQMMLHSKYFYGEDAEREAAREVMLNQRDAAATQNRIANFQSTRDRLASGAGVASEEIHAAVSTNTRQRMQSGESVSTSELLAEMDATIEEQKRVLVEQQRAGHLMADAEGWIDDQIGGAADEFRAKMDALDQRARDRAATTPEMTAAQALAAGMGTGGMMPQEVLSPAAAARAELDALLAAQKAKAEADKKAAAEKIDNAGGKAGENAAAAMAPGKTTFGSFSAAALMAQGNGGGGGVNGQILREAKRGNKEVAKKIDRQIQATEKLQLQMVG